MAKEKIYLGISLGFNCSACVMSTKTGILSAVSQERLTNVKNTKEIPYDAILMAIKQADVNVIDEIAIGDYEDIRTDTFNCQKYKNKNYENIGSHWKDYIFNLLGNYTSCKINCNDIIRIEHQTAHRNTALGFYGVPKSTPSRPAKYFTISSDGFGDGLSASIAFVDNGREKILSTVRTENSLGLVYQFFTGALGFKEHEHEGKITGLAAFGEPIYLEALENLYHQVSYGNGLQIILNNVELTSDEMHLVKDNKIYDFENFLKLKKTIYKFVTTLIEQGATREDLSATVQTFAEKYTLLWLRQTLAQNEITGRFPAYIAGGLFANVKINQRIKDSKLFSQVNVAPPMGDEGTCVGACITLMKMKGECTFKVENMNKATISGPSIESDEEVLKLGLDIQWKSDIKFKITQLKDEADTISQIVDRLANDNVVCLCRGNMEFGPRALCHRSILYNADAYETNNWLNKKLKRSEFMPFAPVVNDMFVKDLFKNFKGGELSAQFMTMTFDATQEFVDTCKAACHVDNTARPQVITQKNDPWMYDLLNQWYDATGKKALINTSYNRHGFPIIMTAKTAIEDWLTTSTECLVIGNVMFELENPVPHE